MAYHTTVPTTSPAPYEEVTLGRRVTAERQTTVPATKRAIIPPYYEEVTPGRQMNTQRETTGSTAKRAIVPPYYTSSSGRQVNAEIKEGEPAYDYPVIAVNKN